MLRKLLRWVNAMNRANAVTKQIMLTVGSLPPEQLARRSAELFAGLNRGPEGREGQTAFAEKRKPAWQEASHDRE